MKDPAVVGHYDTLLTFADRKAERFFATHDFSEDPILTAKYRSEPKKYLSQDFNKILREMVDQWENSSLMVWQAVCFKTICLLGNHRQQVNSFDV